MGFASVGFGGVIGGILMDTLPKKNWCPVCGRIFVPGLGVKGHTDNKKLAIRLHNVRMCDACFVRTWEDVPVIGPWLIKRRGINQGGKVS